MTDNIDAFGRRKKPARALPSEHSPHFSTISTSRSRSILNSIEDESCDHRRRYQQQMQKEKNEDIENEQFDLDEITFEGDDDDIYLAIPVAGPL